MKSASRTLFRLSAELKAKGFRPVRLRAHRFSTAIAVACLAMTSASPAMGQSYTAPLRADTAAVRGSELAPGSTSGGFDWTTLEPVGFSSFSTQPGPVGETPAQLPVDSTYVLAPGDRLGIYLLGRTQREYNLLVNAQGKAYLPGIGVVHLAGKTLAEARDGLRDYLGRYFAEQSIEVLLLEPRRAYVSVVGEATRPGRYSLSGAQTTFDAVLAAGGPTPRGSLRNLVVRHADGSQEKVDLYPFLLKGIGKGGPFLLPGDVVLVPPARRGVALAGAVRHPGRYELLEGRDETVADLIELAGGFTEDAYRERIEISRLIDGSIRRTLYVERGQENRFVLREGDRVRVYSWDDLREPAWVEILGDVRNPGRYPYERNLRLSNLVLRAGGLLRSAYELRAEVDRIEPNQPVRREFFPLAAALSGDESADPVLTEYDRVLIRRIPEWQIGPSVEVRGEVRFPGVYTITRDSTRLSEVLRLAGGFTKNALLREARLIRPSSRVRFDKEYERLKTMRREEMSDLEYEYLVMKESQNVGQVVVDFYRLWVLGDSTQDVILRDGDIIDVPRAPKVIEVTGRVARPGGVLYKPGAGVEYYLAQAGGVAWDGHRKRIKVIKSTGEVLDDEDVRELLPGDIIWVPRKPDRDWWQIVRDVVGVAYQITIMYLVYRNMRS